jgi:hypothetical protein
MVQSGSSGRFLLSPTFPRSSHGVPGEIDVRARLAARGSIELAGAALAIKPGTGFGFFRVLDDPAPPFGPRPSFSRDSQSIGTGISDSALWVE